MLLIDLPVYVKIACYLMLAAFVFAGLCLAERHIRDRRESREWHDEPELWQYRRRMP